MTSNLPLYSRGRLLKNLLADWKRKHNTINLLVEDIMSDYENPTFINFDNGFEEETLYNAVINKWYFSNIGFDSDEEFIFRFNAVWRENISQYRQVYSYIKYKGPLTSKTSRVYKEEGHGDDTTNESGSREVTTAKTGEDTFVKGVTTTSDQETSNQGNKLARQTPNEQLGVTGESHTTVQDSGSDVNQYGSQVVTTETPDLAKTGEYNKNNTIEEDVYREEMSPTILKQLYATPSVTEAFSLLFEKLFLGVF